ncbi:MAG: magnesium transporter CorA family protein [Ignavibacteriae bacterium]|nr:magnesium transporter CorA family protein [Ignavibacteriota bacterium]
MIEFFYSSESERFTPIEQIRKGCWIDMLAPTETELQEISRLLEVELDFLKDPLDSEERSRVEFEEGQMLLIFDIPIVDFSGEGEATDFTIETLPLGVIFLPDHIITVCLKKTPIIEEFKMNRIKQFSTRNKNRFLLQLLQKTATYYLRYLRHINRKTEENEFKLHQSTKNAELFELLNLEKTLVYFTTSLRSNQNAIRRLTRSRLFHWTEEDEELLEDVTIEFDQAIEMTQIYSSILTGLMDTFASVISNNLNMVMKLLTSITIVLAIPTMISSFFGMNVGLPMQDHPFAFLGIIGLTIVLVAGAVFYLNRKNLF